MFTDLWEKAVKIGSIEIEASVLFYLIPGLLLFVLAFYAELSILGLLLVFYAIIAGFTAGVRAVVPAAILMIIASIISINRFGVTSFLNTYVHIAFGIMLSLGIGVLRDKYLDYMANYRLIQFGIENANLMTFLFDENSKIIDANKYVSDLLGFEKEELIGKEFEFLVKEDGEQVYMDCLRDMKYEGPLTFRLTVETKQGKELPVEINCKHLSYNGEEYGFLFAQDITEILKREKDINFLLYRDSLTGLYNRRFFEEELNRLDTSRQLPIAIVMIDVNGLKVINDTYGHKAGDEHLQKVGEILKGSIRQEDILARWAGDEFVILMPNTDYEAARHLYQRIKSNCLISYEDGEPVSVAIGVSVKTDNQTEINSVLEEADKDMYRDKTLNGDNSGEHLIKHMLKELENKSYETREHIERVRILALGLADRLELEDEKREQLEFMAQFHDIGLIMLSEELINKEGRLDKEDWRKLRKHPEHGSRIINSMRAYNEIADNILSHHEWWNGQGYPKGLKGEEIPLCSRIIAIADAYEVMTTGRPYKEAKSHDGAIRELKHYRGIQFDGRLVDEFIEMIEENGSITYNLNGVDTLKTAGINTEVKLDYGDDGRIKEDN